MTRPRLLVAAAALLALACSAPASAPLTGGAAVDPARARLLGALPPEEAARGVYVVDLDAAGELSPGSRLAPIVAPLADDADLLVETTAPPVTLLGGVGAEVGTPAEAVRVDDVLVIAAPEVRDAVAARLRDGAAPDRAFAELAATAAPVAWRGPTPAPNGAGTTTVTLSDDEVQFVVDLDASVVAAQEHARQVLREGGPSGSPGKRWSTVLPDATVAAEDGRLVITAVPGDLPGLFLRVLLDQRQMTFLPTAEQG